MNYLKRKVMVQFIFEGKSFPSDNMPGVLLEENRVLVVEEGVEIYACTPSENPNHYIVNLDTDDRDYLRGTSHSCKNEFLIDLITK
jgi:hypothetical protein